MFTTVVNKLKETSTAVGSLVAIIASIGGAIIYVENNYASAQDVKSILRSQGSQIDLIQRNQLNTQMFQLEHYDQQIRKLELEKAKALVLLSDPATTRSQRAYTRQPDDIQTEVNELKMRRESVRNSIIPAQTK
jgi:hypothetical protein